MSILPIKKSPKIISINRVSTLIHGIAKSGKSTFCSEIPNILALVFEPGWDCLEAYKIDINSWETLVNAYKELKQGAYKNYGGVCIDTADICYDRCAEYICKKYSVDHQADLAHGKGWGFVKTEFRMMLTNLAQLPIPLFIISHSKDIEIEARAEKYKKTVPSLAEAPRKIITGLVDIILYFTIGVTKKGKQVNIIKAKPDKYFEAGDRTGVLPSVMRMKYEEFENAFKAQKQ